LLLRNWLARLSFSFLIIALVLGWEGFKLLGNGGASQSSLRVMEYFAGAVAGFVLALIGARIRYHRDHQ
jgi:hypothetical protein